ncbi:MULTISPECIES: LPXTG cell wall anchor domain-containing protein [unclassified Micromonospora]|uniref:LPXTG cell wall anchor domain-containing protein n=1 Tax=unclassified Micromonospora TaxID=2617518 RepID=UPI0003EEDF06|nr:MULTISPECIES: LPXTG cell wall anchor domain-containing protein [unclassified Micromonospora]EWM66785.1 LPXTG-protein cell wall anchor protein [Micromonospora sp. M42]MCK1805949.1 ALF repeat-containing protein [Micromonospora sp. R42106]MCK1830491.1 ALF repeat-containing protein [Micromonospora sp. R42003]MCK1842354.1 ALF repeat-containing protein [Micromonospora sp. R42004]MCM1018748.1 ALF repeat-containing protein [Micromonospora sp. XM-20-01]
MRWKIPAGALVALAFVIPAAPAAAQTAVPGLNDACQTVERKVYKDFRELVTIDLDTANVSELRLLAYRLLAEAQAESLPVLPGEIEERLKGTSDDLRAYLKNVENRWATALRVSIGQTMTGAGPNVRAAAQKVLDNPSVEAYLAYLNNGLYEARALDCASQPTPTPSQPTTTPTATPSATSTVVPPLSPSASVGVPGGEGGGLPVTGSDTATVAGIGGALLLLGGASYVIGRRRRSRFVA